MPPVDPQHLSSAQAYLLGLIFPSIYVGSLYVSKNARLSFSSTSKNTTKGPRLRESNERWRDDPDTFIHAGGYALTLMGMPSFEISSYLLPAGLWHAFAPHLLAPLLFLGPLYAQYLIWFHPRRTWSLKSRIWETYATWQGLRNYIVAPITEELVFRACVLSVYYLGKIPRLQMIWLGPLNFGLAHLHHAWDTYNRFGRTANALKRAVVSSLFQLAYTTLFGAFCTFIFLRTASLAPVINAHIFCNVMGIPDVAGDLNIGAQNRRKYVVIAAYVVGAVGFGFAMNGWTNASAKKSFLWKV
ncbi:prenyl proteinase rce1 [Moniliophthora roreri]|nr:prenyl proteinase rce1 [Moniliophthora roreri]